MSDGAEFLLNRDCTVTLPCVVANAPAFHEVTFHRDWSMTSHHDAADVIAATLADTRLPCADLPAIVPQARRIAAHRAGVGMPTIDWDGTCATIPDDAFATGTEPMSTRDRLHARMRSSYRFESVAGAVSHLCSTASATDHRQTVDSLLVALTDAGMISACRGPAPLRVVDELLSDDAFVARLRDLPRPATSVRDDTVRDLVAAETDCRIYTVADTTLTCATTDGRLAGVLERTTPTGETRLLAAFRSTLRSEVDLFVGNRVVGNTVLDRTLANLSTEAMRRNPVLVDRLCVVPILETECGPAETARWLLHLALTALPGSIPAERFAVLVAAAHLGLLPLIDDAASVEDLALRAWRHQHPDDWARE